jgi:FkbM family methyltransferase
MLDSLDGGRDSIFEAHSKAKINEFETTILKNRWAFGRNLYSEALSGAKLISGFIDDFSDSSEWMGLPVIRSNEIKPEYFIIIAAGGNTQSIKRQLEKIEVRKMDYFAFQRWSKFKLPQIRFNEDFEEHFKSNAHKFEDTYTKLQDKTSKEIFKKIVNFRLTQNMEYLDGFKENQENQYFDFISQIKDKINNFVDIGAYRAENSITFMKANPGYSKVVLVEPNSENFKYCVSETREFSNISYVQAVLGGDQKEVEFLGEGTTGVVVETGGSKVQMKTLDSICTELVGTTLIKMDVEGGEEQILLGGIETLDRLRPILAISGYHRIQDFWKIPEIIFSILDDYSMYIRHYTETIYETVFYFIPNETSLELT